MCYLEKIVDVSSKKMGFVRRVLMSIAFTDWVIEEQEREERLDLKEHTKKFI